MTTIPVEQINCLSFIHLGIFYEKHHIVDCKMENKSNYDVILSQTTLNSIETYKNALLLSATQPGAYMKEQLKKIDLKNASNEEFIQSLLWTKKPMIFAEQEIIGDGTDWNKDELKLLGDINIAMNVFIYDNGVWYVRNEHFRQHMHPMNGTLLFTPGPLLEYFRGRTPDLEEIIDKDGIDQGKYNRLISRRITPLLYYTNQCAAKENIQAFVTIPGIGCGQFAGCFAGTMGERLNIALQAILKEHAHAFESIACIYYDPYGECSNEEFKFGNVIFRVRPALKNFGKSLLCEPKQYEEEGDDFKNCKIFKLVAWDHASYPGNDFFGNNRATDDGVSAAATNSMQMITGINGYYQNGKYLPPSGNKNWLQVVKDNNITMKANEQNIHII